MPESICACRLLGKRSAFLFGTQPVGHLEFLTKLAQVPVSSAVNYVNVIKKEYQEYQQEKGLTSQDAQDEQYEQYSNPNIKDNSLFTVPLDFERLPFVELRLVDAGKVGGSKFLDVHTWPPYLKSCYHRFPNRINADRGRGQPEVEIVQDGVQGVGESR